MATERQWVEAIKPALEEGLAHEGIKVAVHHKLPYTLHVASYKSEPGQLAVANPVPQARSYQTDFLIAEQLEGGVGWVPRVVVEFKFQKVTTHDALTYSAKAATHKSVHPYLRYGIVIGGFDGTLPKRLLRHGHHFDFMVTVPSVNLTMQDRDRLVRLLEDEVRASRTLGKLTSEKSDIFLLHRKLHVA
jgi:hypothetical protein